MKNKKFLIAILAFVIVAITAFFAFNARQQEQRISTESLKAAAATENTQKSAPLQKSTSLKDLQRKTAALHPMDIIETTNQDAPITFIEYASYSCSHCGNFYKNIYPKLKDKYIATGKLKFIFRDFPLDEPSLRASQLVHCLPEESQQGFMKVLFEKQSSWAYTKDFPEKLENLAKIAGMPADDFHACMADEALEQRILKRRIEANDAFSVSSTPSFIINGQRYSGRNSWKEISAHLDNLLQ